jgi:monoamine oxidase
MVHGSRAFTWPLIRALRLETRPLPAWDTTEWDTKKGFVDSKEDGAVERLYRAYVDYHGEDITLAEFLARNGFSAEDRESLAHRTMSWSAEPDEMSLSAAVEDSAAWDIYEEQNYQIVPGNDSLTAGLASRLGNAIRLSHTVSEIQWKGERVQLTCRTPKGAISIRARCAVVTLPIGVLQRNLVAFTPALPEWKQRAIDSMKMGRVVVGHLLFDDRFWMKAFQSGTGWSTRGSRVSFDCPHPPGKGLPALRAWISGYAAQEISDLGADGGLHRLLTWIEDVFPHENVRKRLQWSTVRDWVADPYTFGSYSFPKPGGNALRPNLAAPIRGLLFFAGEATETPPHYQTVHGAYHSGRRAAREVLSTFRIDAPLLEPL